MRSRLEPLKKVARSLRRHRPLLLNWFRAKGEISAGVVEGFNYKAKLTMRKAYGFREFETIELALYHQTCQPHPARINPQILLRRRFFSLGVMVR
jgi:transposase